MLVRFLLFIYFSLLRLYYIFYFLYKKTIIIAIKLAILRYCRLRNKNVTIRKTLSALKKETYLK